MYKANKFIHLNNYKHYVDNKPDSYTLTYEYLSQNDVKNIMKDFLDQKIDSIYLIFGETKVSKKDNYVKEIGRKESIKIMNGCIYIYLDKYYGGFGRLILKSHPKSKYALMYVGF